MSVYTTVEHDELVRFLQRYDAGDLTSYRGISEGIENTNYFVNTSKGEFVLTLFESLDSSELPYFLDIMAFLAEHDVPSAHPIADNAGHYLQQLNGKPAALVMKLEGHMVETPTHGQVRELGAAVGRMHAVGQAFQAHRDNNRGPHWWRETTSKLQPKIDASELEALMLELKYQSGFRHENLPRGIIHADLFRDNALWLDDHLTGIIDFYYACNDVLLYDVAVIANDWCTREDGSLDEDKTHLLLQSYHGQRPLSEEEHRAWPVMLRAGALRFWLSRLHDLHFPREGEITHTKDPDAFRRILEYRVAHSEELEQVWI
jgi:homoserine kinase type II